jgi:hypothetical protein
MPPSRRVTRSGTTQWWVPFSSLLALLGRSAKTRSVGPALSSRPPWLPGLAHMEPTAENSLRAHSYGCGQLIAAALEAGATEIVLGLGGSAMSDAGSGALRALGLKPLDSAGNVVPLGGGSLADVVTLDVSELDPRLSEREVPHRRRRPEPAVRTRRCRACLWSAEGRG